MTTAPASPVIAPELHRSAGWVQVLMIGWTHVVLGLAARAVTSDAATNA